MRTLLIRLSLRPVLPSNTYSLLASAFAWREFRMNQNEDEIYFNLKNSTSASEPQVKTATALKAGADPSTSSGQALGHASELPISYTCVLPYHEE